MYEIGLVEGGDDVFLHAVTQLAHYCSEATHCRGAIETIINLTRTFEERLHPLIEQRGQTIDPFLLTFQKL